MKFLVLVTLLLSSKFALADCPASFTALEKQSRDMIKSVGDLAHPNCSGFNEKSLLDQIKEMQSFNFDPKDSESISGETDSVSCKAVSEFLIANHYAELAKCLNAGNAEKALVSPEENKALEFFAEARAIDKQYRENYDAFFDALEEQSRESINEVGDISPDKHANCDHVTESKSSKDTLLTEGLKDRINELNTFDFGPEDKKQEKSESAPIPREAIKNLLISGHYGDLAKCKNSLDWAHKSMLSVKTALDSDISYHEAGIAFVAAIEAVKKSGFIGEAALGVKLDKELPIAIAIAEKLPQTKEIVEASKVLKSK